MSKKSSEPPARAKSKKGLVRFPSGNMTAQAVIEAAQHAKDKMLPSTFLVDGNTLSIFSVPASGGNSFMTRTDVLVFNESGVRATGRADELSAEIAKTSQPSALLFEGSKVHILDSEGVAADGVGGAGIVSEDDHSTVWGRLVAPLREVGSIPTSLLRGLLDSTQAFIGEDDTRGQLCWCPIEVSPGFAQGVATNGHILVLRQVRSPLISVPAPVKLGVPRTALRALGRFQDPTTYLYKHPDADNPCWMARCGARSVHMTHLDSFPPYNTLLPSDRDRYVAFDVSAPLLRKTIAEVAASASKTEKKAVVLTVEADRLTVLVGDTALRWTLPVEWTRGKPEPFRSVVDARYLAQVTRAITAGGVTTRVERVSSRSASDAELAPLYVQDVPFGGGFEEASADSCEAITALMPMRG